MRTSRISERATNAGVRTGVVFSLEAAWSGPEAFGEDCMKRREFITLLGVRRRLGR
jgi:hypothetical protein